METFVRYGTRYGSFNSLDEIRAQIQTWRDEILVANDRGDAVETNLLLSQIEGLTEDLASCEKPAQHTVKL